MDFRTPFKNYLLPQITVPHQVDLGGGQKNNDIMSRKKVTDLGNVF